MYVLGPVGILWRFRLAGIFSGLPQLGQLLDGPSETGLRLRHTVEPQVLEWRVLALGQHCRLQELHFPEDLADGESLGLDGGDCGRHQLVDPQAETDEEEEFEFLHGAPM